MLAFIQRHSAGLLILAALCGFIFPDTSAAIFPYLPYILFFLMLFTLVGIQPRELIRTLRESTVWGYAILHSLGCTTLGTGLGVLFHASPSVILAIAGVAATGSLFATPAIARSVGLDPRQAMAMTIATTLLMPAVLYLNLCVFQDQAFTLNLSEYLQRLLIYIAGPMVISGIVFRLISPHTLQHAHRRLSSITILLVFTFPFGLVGPFREAFDQSAQAAFIYLLIASALCVIFFSFAFVFYRRHSLNSGLLSALTAANRNVLLTYTVAGSYLGSEYVILMAAIQLPTYTLPLIVRAISRYYATSPTPSS